LEKVGGMKTTKKTAIVLFFFLVAGILFYRQFSAPHLISATGSDNDTILVKQHCESAKALQQNNPDSAIIEYQKAIQLLEDIPKNDRIKHLLATVYLDLSYVYLPKGNYDLLKEYAHKGLAIAGKDDREINARALTYEGLVYYQQGELDSALFVYAIADSLAKQAGARKLQTKILSNTAIIYYIRGNHKKAIAGFTQAQAIGIELKDEELITDSYINLGVVYTGMRDFEKAKDSYAKAIEYYLKNKQDDNLALCYMNLGNVYYYMENYAEALALYQQLLALAIKTGNKQSIAKGYNNIGEIHKIIGDYDHAAEMYFNALKIKEEISDKASMPPTYRALAGIYFNQKTFSKALEYYQKALDIDSALNLVNGMATDYAAISAVYREYKQSKEAIDYGLKAIRLYRQAEDARGESEAYKSLGFVYLDQKKYDEAFMYYQQALAQKENLSFDREGLASIYIELANFYLSKPDTNFNDLKHAERYGLSAYHIVDSLEEPLLIAQASEVLAQVYEKQQNFRQAVRFLEVNKQAADSLFSQSKAEALIFAEARWNNEKRQEEIRNLEKLNQSILIQKEEEHKRHQLVLYGLIIIFTLIALASVLFWKYKHKQREIRFQQQFSHIAVLRLQNIQNRISPHFTFNVLNAVIPALRKHEELSRPMQLLVQSIRGNLQASDKIAIPLEEEIAIVKNYMELHESIRPGFLQMEWNIGNEVDRQILLPSMMIQIPVENALKYAFEDGNKDNLVAINVTQNPQSVDITIEDNGIGFNPGKYSGDTRSSGNGLKILFKTVELLNRKNQHPLKFDIQNLSESSGLTGTKVHIIIPLDYKYSV
jgi:tetratricopeptide (TPR) repeat protein